MKYLVMILALTSLTTITVAAPADLQVIARPTQASLPGTRCGKCISPGISRVRELRTSVPATKCNTLPEGEQYRSCTNQYCGMCVMFKDNDCQGDITYWGGAGAGSFDAKGARSYYCV